MCMFDILIQTQNTKLTIFEFIVLLINEIKDFNLLANLLKLKIL